MGFPECASMLRTEIMPVFGSRDPTTFTFSPDYCSANTCVSSLYNLSGVLQYESRAALFLIYRTYKHLTPKGASTMEWVTPQHEEIDLNCEVSSYANAEL